MAIRSTAPDLWCPIGTLLLELAELELQNPPHYAVD